jgi:hypothetical protein
VHARRVSPSFVEQHQSVHAILAGRQSAAFLPIALAARQGIALARQKLRKARERTADAPDEIREVHGITPMLLEFASAQAPPP